MAIASDTAIALETSHGCKGDPITVLITMEDCRMALSPSIDTIVTLRRKQQQRQELFGQDNQKRKIHNRNDSNTETAGVDNDMYVHSLWNAEICSSVHAHPRVTEDRVTVVEYAVMERIGSGEKEIHWKPSTACSPDAWKCQESLVD